MDITKIVTENPLIDELVYYSKIMALGTILKMDSEADKYETAQTLNSSDIYMSCIEGKASHYMFEYTVSDLISVGILSTDPRMNTFLQYPDRIPEPYKTNLLNKSVKNYIDNYEEQNEYYRMLNGLPKYRYQVIPEQYTSGLSRGITYIKNYIDPLYNPTLDLKKPVHKLTTEEINEIIYIGEQTEIDYLNNILTSTGTSLKTNIDKKGIETKRIVYPHWLFVPDKYEEEVESYLLDMTTPIHQFDHSAISAIELIGAIDELKELHPEAKYLNFLGSKSIDIYTARKGRNFEILYVPTIAADVVYNNFYNRLSVNRDFVLKTVYSEAYKLKSDFYDNYIAILIILLSVIDMIIQAPEYLIKKDLFDLRTIEYLLESYGIEFYPEIPLKYQQKILRNLNLFLKYKSSPKCMQDICNIFDIDDVVIYRYFLLKERKAEDGNFEFVDTTNIRVTHTKLGNEINYSGVYILENREKSGTERVWNQFDEVVPTRIISTIYHSDGHWILKDTVNDTIIATMDDKVENNDPIGTWILMNVLSGEIIHSRFASSDIDDYELSFCKVPLDDSVESSLRKSDRYRDYYSVISNDPYWLGDRSFEEVQQEILKYEFNYVRSKYFSIDTIYDMSELALQRPYFYSLIFEEDKYAENLTIPVARLSQNRSFRFNDLICYLFSLSYLYYGIKDEINVSKEKIMYILGFNFEDDITYLQNYFINHQIEFDVSKYDKPIDALQGYLEYNYIEDLNITDFVPPNRYPTYESLLYRYTNNVDIRRELVQRMNDADNKRIYNIYKTIYDATMIQIETNNFFKNSEGLFETEYDPKTKENIVTYAAFIQARDPILGESLNTIKAITDDYERTSVITDIISSTVESIEYYMDTDQLRYIFSNMASVSYEAVSGYIKRLINFFKSFTVQLAELNSIYKIHAPFDNKLSPIDQITSMITLFDFKDLCEVKDRLSSINTIRVEKDEIGMYDKLYIDYIYDSEEKNNE